MIIPIKQKQGPKINETRVIKKYAWIPTKVKISNDVCGWIWLEKYDEVQKYYVETTWDGTEYEWRTMSKTLKTKALK